MSRKHVAAVAALACALGFPGTALAHDHSSSAGSQTTAIGGDGGNGGNGGSDNTQVNVNHPVTIADNGLGNKGAVANGSNNGAASCNTQDNSGGNGGKGGKAVADSSQSQSDSKGDSSSKTTAVGGDGGNGGKGGSHNEQVNVNAPVTIADNGFANSGAVANGSNNGAASDNSQDNSGGNGGNGGGAIAV